MTEASSKWRWTSAVAVLAFAFLGTWSLVDATEPHRHSGYSDLDVTPIEVSTPAPVKLNTASVEELAAVPGIGEQRARAIVDYRDRNGPFQSVEDLLDVEGIGALELSAFVDRLTVQ